MVSPLSSCHSPLCSPVLNPRSRQRLGLFLALVLGFALVEWLVGHHSHSLALQSDAGHMLTDAGAIALALSGSWLTRLSLLRRGRRWGRYDRLAALVNGVILLLIAVLLAWEAWHHLTAPPMTLVSQPMVITALLGLGVNGLGVWLLHADQQSDINLHGAFLHTLADLISSIGVIIGALAVAIFHCGWVDGAISLGIALLIGSRAVPFIYRSWQHLGQTSRDDLAALGFLELGRGDLQVLVARSTAVQ